MGKGGRTAEFGEVGGGGEQEPMPVPLVGAVADEFQNLRGDERDRFRMVQPKSAREPLLCEKPGLMQRQLIQPLASLIATGEIGPGGRVRADLNSRKDKLVLRDVDDEACVPA